MDLDWIHHACHSFVQDTVPTLTCANKDRISSRHAYAQAHVLHGHTCRVVGREVCVNSRNHTAILFCVLPSQYVAGYKITKFSPFNPVDKKTTAISITPTGETLMTTKGAPQIIADMLSDEDAQKACHDYIAERASRGLRSLGVARSDDDGQVRGGWGSVFACAYTWRCTCFSPSLHGLCSLGVKCFDDEGWVSGGSAWVCFCKNAC